MKTAFILLLCFTLLCHSELHDHKKVYLPVSIFVVELPLKVKPILRGLNA